MKGWVDLGVGYTLEIVYLSTSIHPSNNHSIAGTQPDVKPASFQSYDVNPTRYHYANKPPQLASTASSTVAIALKAAN